MSGDVAIAETKGSARSLPRLADARQMFDEHVYRDPAELRKVYLRLALQYHPDKRHERERQAATELFQALGAVYEELTQRLEPGVEAPKRTKSPVAIAAELGDLKELQRLLVAAPEKANEVDDLGVFPIMFAASGGCLAAAELLLEYSANVQARNPINWTVLLYGALGNHAHMVKFLVAQGAEVTEHELVLAAYTGNPDALKALLELYAGDISSLRTSESRKSLLHLACEGMCFLRHTAERHAACVNLALKWGVPINATEPRRGRTCLQDYVGDIRWRTRCFENSKVHVDVVEKLCLHGASVVAEVRG